ncbi:MAG TPA: serine hydroxymethyltransferase [Desulfobacterales bacterium]
MNQLQQDDPALARLIEAEARRIETTLDLIAAESHPPIGILEAQGSVFCAKTAEGYPGRRFHGGCRPSDALETLAVARAQALFEAEHANVQPHSGTSANLAVYAAILQPGDKMVALELSQGGHLSHGAGASLTGRLFDCRHYGVDSATGRIDYDRIRKLVRAFRPKLLIAGASAYPRLIDYERLATIASDGSAYLMVDMAHIAGLVAARVIPSPVPWSDFVTFTTYKTLMGGRGGVILCRRAHAAAIDAAVFPGVQGTPALNQIAAKALCFARAAGPDFVAMQRAILTHAADMARELKARGYRLVSGGTDNHLVLIDLRSRGITGKYAEQRLQAAGIVANRNAVPNDPQPPTLTSGLRIGTTGLVARNMGSPEVKKIIELIDRVLTAAGDEVLEAVAAEVAALCRRFPVYGQPELPQRG